jgi:hypothetical protein
MRCGAIAGPDMLWFNAAAIQDGSKQMTTTEVHWRRSGIIAPAGRCQRAEET